MEKRPIVIQGALQSEIDLLLKQLMPNARKEVRGVVFYEGNYRGYPVAVCKTKMGEIAAAIATTVAIGQYAPAFILNQGTAGAFDRALHTGDVIVGERVAYISQFATKPDKETDPLNQWKSEGYCSIDGERISLTADARLITWLKSLSLPAKGKLLFGTVGSGDSWTLEEAQIDSYRDRLGILCEAMECTGVYMAANCQNIPAVSLRVISNNELLGEAYMPESADVAARCAVAVLDAWIDLGDSLPF